MAEHIQIGDIAPRVQYTAAEEQTVFTYPFPIFEAADMEVYIGDALQETGYTVTGAGDSAGGDVTFDTAPRSTGAAAVTITLRRQRAIQRNSDFQEGGAFRAKVINDELDRLVAGLQQLADDIKRAIMLSPTDPASPQTTLPLVAADRILGWNADGTALENKELALLNTVKVSDAAPQALGTVDGGSAAEISRADHVHPLPGLSALGAEAANAALLKSNQSTTLSVGYVPTVHDLGNTGAATITPNLANGYMQKATVTGSFTLAAPSTVGALWLNLTNDATGGYSPIVSGFATVAGTYNAAAGAINIFRITRDDSGSYLEIIKP